MIRSICRMGNPILRRKGNIVTKDYLFSDEFSQLVRDMKDSMVHYGSLAFDSFY